MPRDASGISCACRGRVVIESVCVGSITITAIVRVVKTCASISVGRGVVVVCDRL